MKKNFGDKKPRSGWPWETKGYKFKLATCSVVSNIVTSFNSIARNLFKFYSQGSFMFLFIYDASLLLRNLIRYYDVFKNLFVFDLVVGLIGEYKLLFCRLNLSFEGGWSVWWVWCNKWNCRESVLGLRRDRKQVEIISLNCSVLKKCLLRVILEGCVRNKRYGIVLVLAARPIVVSLFISHVLPLQ